MRTVQSVAELKRLSLNKGSPVSIGSSRFNTSGEKGQAIPRPTVKEPEKEKEVAPKPEPVAAHVTPVVNVDMTPIAQAHDRMSQLIEQLIASMPKQDKQVPMRFTIKRNVNGFIESIDAYPIKEKS